MKIKINVSHIGECQLQKNNCTVYHISFYWANASLPLLSNTEFCKKLRLLFIILPTQQSCKQCSDFNMSQYIISSCWKPCLIFSSYIIAKNQGLRDKAHGFCSWEQFWSKVSPITTTRNLGRKCYTQMHVHAHTHLHSLNVWDLHISYQLGRTYTVIHWEDETLLKDMYCEEKKSILLTSFMKYDKEQAYHKVKRKRIIVNLKCYCSGS
jgi:hypothetical protein